MGGTGSMHGIDEKWIQNFRKRARLDGTTSGSRRGGEVCIETDIKETRGDFYCFDPTEVTYKGSAPCR